MSWVFYIYMRNCGMSAINYSSKSIDTWDLSIVKTVSFSYLCVKSQELSSVITGLVSRPLYLYIQALVLSLTYFVFCDLLYGHLPNAQTWTHKLLGSNLIQIIYYLLSNRNELSSSILNNSFRLQSRKNKMKCQITVCFL